MAHHGLPKDLVGVLYRNMNTFGLAAVGDLFEQIVGAFTGYQPRARERDTHVSDRIGEEIRRPRIQVDRHVLQGFLAVWVFIRSADGLKGNGVFRFVQAKGHGVEVVLGAVYSVIQSGLLAVFGGLDRVHEGLQQDDVVVHRVDPFLGVRLQLKPACQFAIGQLQHDGEGALAVEGRTDCYQRGVLHLA